MNKAEIAAYFDAAAPTWDDHMITDDGKITFFLDGAGVRENAVVLDVACGTGVLFPYYLRRGAARVVGVDLSPEMVRIASAKCHDPRVEVICGDMEAVPVLRRCDSCMVYNAFPHFPEPAKLLAALARWVKPGGRLAVAHSMSLQALRRHHAGSARAVSREMLSPEELAALMAPWFQVDIALADGEKYLVAGTRNRECAEPGEKRGGIPSV